MLSGKKVLVLGLARSGMAATRLLCKLNATVTVNEGRTLNQLREQEELKQLNVEIIDGGHPIELFERDFDFVVKNPGIKYTMPFIRRLQERNIPIYTEIELAFQVAKPQHYIAITGTNGKTTTATLTYHILKKEHPNTYLAGNIGIPLCDIVLNHQLMESNWNYIVLEMSNFQLLNIDQFRPEISVITNLTPDHLDYMETVEDYYISKTKIYQNQTSNDYFILNQDDQTIQTYVQQYPTKATKIPFSLDNLSLACIQNHHILYKGEKVYDLNNLKIVGKHNVQNVMIALCIAKCLNIPNSTIRDALDHFYGVEHRVEFVREINGIKFYNDSKATNVDSTLVAIDAFTSPIILLLGGFDKGLDLSRLKKKNNIKAIVCFGEAGKRFSKELHSPYYEKELKDAIIKSYALANEGDIILLSPSTSSFDQFDSYEQRGRYFKKIVNTIESL